MMHSIGVPQQESSLCLSISNKKVMIINVDGAGKLIKGKGNMIFSVQFRPRE